MAKAGRKKKSSARAAKQPFKYPLDRPFEEPDWRRFPGWRDVSRSDWESALWQRRNSVKNLKELKKVFGPLLPDDLVEDVERDQRERATMSLLIPPQLLNTMDEKDLWADPSRRYLLPALKDRRHDFPNHPRASRDSLHEAGLPE